MCCIAHFVGVAAPELLCRKPVTLAAMTIIAPSAMLFPLQLGVSILQCSVGRCEAHTCSACLCWMVAENRTGCEPPCKSRKQLNRKLKRGMTW